MPFLPTDLAQEIREMIAHVASLPPEAGAPLAHYDRSIRDIWNLLRYFERNFKRLSLQPAALRTHMTRLHGMILVNLVETFERYLKEVAAACVDCLAQYVLDDRFNAFRVQGSALAAHFGSINLSRSPPSQTQSRGAIREPISGTSPYSSNPGITCAPQL